MKFLAFFGVLLAAQLASSNVVPTTMEEIEEQLKIINDLQKNYDLTPEQRFNLGIMGGWLRDRAVAIAVHSKNLFMAAGGEAMLQQAKQMMLSSVKVEPMTCENKLCSACLTANIPPLNGKTACVEVGMTSESVAGASLEIDGESFMNRSIDLDALTSSCVSLPFPVGEVCLQGLKNAGDEDGFCITCVIKNFSIGRQLCANVVDGKLVPSVKSATVAATVVDNQVIKLEGDVVTSLIA
ncbi:DUF4773 domain-containing protein [Neisseria meningitidis]|nr:DUF4773 domain-containing protein [Neisseria meningitidis]